MRKMMDACHSRVKDDFLLKHDVEVLVLSLLSFSDTFLVSRKGGMCFYLLRIYESGLENITFLVIKINNLDYRGFIISMSHGKLKKLAFRVIYMNSGSNKKGSYSNHFANMIIWLVVWVLWQVKFCRLYNAKSVFLQIIRSISNYSD